ncbi:type II secretion system protein [Humisphaera borealis]|uniref:Type II secretion system protein n=1 Tax=Humisphaera borealis TaxID=2807512 RepID=A0A7M2WXT1_9BACT|nr:type II secretion system protein [Humisphaera borealis]QOV90164.1 type II secretion system protein [Humisphaera borealis]
MPTPLFSQHQTPITHHRPTAFTLIELLVVVGIMGVLTSILLPAVGRARSQARLVREVAAARTLGQAYLAYAAANEGRLMPGHVTTAPQLKDDQGKPLTPLEAGKRWPWRLAVYTGGGVDGILLVNDQSDALMNNRADSGWGYSVSLNPSFGLNYFHLGGDQTAPANNAPGCVTRLSQVIRPSQMVAFASSRFVGTKGFFRVVAPTHPSGYSATGWTPNAFDEAEEPAAWGYVDFRWSGRAVCAMLDGHAEALRLDELRDMTRWSNEAARTNNPAWKFP